MANGFGDQVAINTFLLIIGGNMSKSLGCDCKMKGWQLYNRKNILKQRNARSWNMLFI